MNGRRAKQLRAEAKEKAFEYYKTLLDESMAAELTKEQAVQYTPTVSYVKIQDGHGENNVMTVSEHTMRWFILEEKKSYGTSVTKTSTYRRQHIPVS